MTRTKSSRALVSVVLAVLMAVAFMPAISYTSFAATAKKATKVTKVYHTGNKTYTRTVGSAWTLKYKLSPSKLTSAAKKVVWKSSKRRVATVNRNGQVIARGKGTAVITAKIAGTNVYAQSVVTVKNYITMRVRTTGYCNCRSCAGKWAGCATASGTRPKEKRTIAVDKRLIHLGTKVKIGNIIYTAEDTGSAIKGKRIDVYYASHRKATAHGVKYQKIKVYI